VYWTTKEQLMKTLKREWLPWTLTAITLVVVILIQQRVVIEARADERMKVRAEDMKAGLVSQHSPNSLYIMVTSMSMPPLKPAIVPGSELPALATLLLRDQSVSSVLVTRGTEDNNFRVAFEPIDPNHHSAFEFNDSKGIKQ
jgi:hypothetical protein